MREFDNFSVCLFVRSFNRFVFRSAIKEEEEEEIEEKGERNLTKSTTDGLTELFSQTSILKFAHDEKQISDRKRASL